MFSTHAPHPVPRRSVVRFHPGAATLVGGVAVMHALLVHVLVSTAAFAPSPLTQRAQPRLRIQPPALVAPSGVDDLPYALQQATVLAGFAGLGTATLASASTYEAARRSFESAWWQRWETWSAATLGVTFVLAGRSHFVCRTGLEPRTRRLRARPQPTCHSAPVHPDTHTCVPRLGQTMPEAFKAIYPPLGTWGCWYLPGSSDFHVAWTGALPSYHP